MIGAVTAPIISGKMHFLLISENEFNHEIKSNGMTSFMDFMLSCCQSVFLFTTLALHEVTGIEKSLLLFGPDTGE